MYITEENAKELQRIFKLSDPKYFESKVGKRLILVNSIFVGQMYWILTYKFSGETGIAFVISKTNKAFFRDLLAMTDGESLTPQGWHIEPKAIKSDMWVATPPEEAEIAFLIGSKDTLPTPADFEEDISPKEDDDLDSLVVTEENYEALSEALKVGSVEYFKRQIGKTLTLTHADYKSSFYEWTLRYEWKENEDYFWMIITDPNVMIKIRDISDGKLIPKVVLIP